MRSHLPGMLRALIHLATSFARAGFHFRFGPADVAGRTGYRNLNPNDRRRFRQYYYGAHYLADLFGAVLNRHIRLKERISFGSLSALAALFDDLSEQADNPVLSLSVHHTSASGEAARAHELLFAVRKLVPVSNAGTFHLLLNRIYELESRKSSGMDFSALEMHGGEKGGSSVLLFRLLFSEKLLDHEMDVWMQTGAFIQLCDDVLDLWFDYRNQIPTAARVLAEYKGVKAMQDYFLLQFHQTIHIVNTLSIVAARQHRLKCRIAVLAAIVLAGLKRYESLEKHFGALPFHNRQAMILDMGRWRNRVAVLRQMWLLRW